MATRVIDPIGEAITATEKEIAGAAWGDEEPVLDETGDRTIETMGEGLEGQHEPDDDDETAEGEEPEDEAESEEGEGDDGEAEPEVKEPPGEEKPAVRAEGEREGRVPSGRLREANERAKALETQLETERTNSAQQIAALNARFDKFVADLSRNIGQKPEERSATDPKAPDFFEDPAGFLAAQTKPLVDTVSQLQQQLATQRVETSMEIAHSKHGDTFAKAFEAVSKLNPQNPDDRVTVQRIYANPNPGEALVAWHKRSETLREVGDDPSKYRERVAAETRESLMKDPEFRKALLADLRAEASRGDDGKPNTTVRLPKSLNGAAGGNRRDATAVQYDDNDSAIAAAAWADR
jgi:hypothetical protein